MERPVDFARARHMACAQCGHRWMVDLDWIDRWERAQEECPGCGVTCENEAAPRVTVASDDLALNDDTVCRLVWYHTSTQPDWPTRDFDPAAGLTYHVRQMMGGDDGVARWAESQRSKALHVGTYESAIHNMLRRIDDQADHGNQFFLYRVHLKTTITVRESWLIDPSNFVGDVILSEVCPPGIDVVRYLNYHEDPGGLSLALGREAIASTQQIAIPLSSAGRRDWIARTVSELGSAVEAYPSPSEDRLLGRRTSSPEAIRAREIIARLADRLPINLQSQFQSATTFIDAMDHETWARNAVGVVEMIENPELALAELDAREARLVEGT